METTSASRKVSESCIHANEWQDEGCENMESLCAFRLLLLLYLTPLPLTEKLLQKIIPPLPQYFLKAEFN